MLQEEPLFIAVHLHSRWSQDASENRREDVTYVDPRGIQVIEARATGGSVIWAGGHSLRVDESPEEVMTMVMERLRGRDGG